MNPERNLSKPAPELQTAVADFRTWFESERLRGLVDIKFCPGNVDSSKASVAKALYEVLTSNKMIDASITEPHLENF